MRFRTGFSVALLAALTAAAACDRSPPPGAQPAASASGRSVRPQGPAGDPTLPEELEPKAEPEAKGEEDAGAKELDWKGPWFVVTSVAAAVYPNPEFDKDKKLGYVRNGGRVPVQEKPVSTKSCSGGWYQIVTGGYVCGNLGTTDLEHPQVKFALKAPDLDAVLPYQYARNAKNGTPLYRSVPSREQMYKYEPYLPGAKKAKEKEEQESDDDDDKTVRRASVVTDGGAPDRPQIDRALADAGILTQPTDGGSDEPEKPWWQQENAKDKLHEVTLEQLEAEGDDILAKRMVAGFYIAVDKTFSWNGRTWYKSTKGLVAPADRFWITAGSKFQGVELGGDFKLPIAWVYGGRKTAPTYEIEEGSSSPKPAKAIEAFTAIQLTGKSQEVGGTRYLETKDNTWIKAIHVRETHPGPPPKDLKPNERWIDVNLSEQTLVAFEGGRPVYATMVSTGKHSSIKDKDHSTPTGAWRIREKHVTTTMDGNGTAAGDLPYSIEDVPYVMYFHRSYAVHGAFWHRNFGVQMSHGCVNLAPLDAKHLFFFADPPMPKGWHGAWSSGDRPGSLVVIHD